MSSDNPIVSTGRGGSGNIGHDTRKYVDGGVVREGVVGESEQPEYSSGRGGAGNIIASPRLGAQSGASQFVVPDENVLDPERNSSTSYHTGRGGGGNVHKAKKDEHHHEQGKGEKLLDKAKDLFHVHQSGSDQK